MLSGDWIMNDCSENKAVLCKRGIVMTIYRTFLRICQWGRGGGGIYKMGLYYAEYGEMTDGCWWQKVWCGVVCNSRGVWAGHSPPENICTLPPLRLHFVRFLKQIFGYTVLHYTVDRANLQLSTCMVCLCKYHNSITNLFCLAFQKHKSIGNF